MVGYAEKGFMYEASIDETIDIDLARKILHEADKRVVRNHLLSTDLQNLGLGGRLVPLFSLTNYTPRERVAMRRLHPEAGGGLRESVTEQSRELSSRRWTIAVTWRRPYLGYLLEHGVSRHPGTTVQFAERIKSKGEVARYLRAEIAAICHNVGVNPSAINVTFGGMITA